MKNKNKISVTIITGNEEGNIRECLESAKWADEIIVVDSESTDKTVEIAKSFTEKVFIRKWEGYASQKSFAMNQASNEWVLSLDADERATQELAEEILSSDIDNFDGYKIRRNNYFIGKQITGCGWGNDYQLRLFKKSKTKLTDRLVHEGFIVDGNISELKAAMKHFSYRNLKDGFSKINEYSTLEANEKAKRKRITGLRLVFFPIWAFIQHYFIRKGFKDGKHGLIVSLMHAITKLQVYMKIWEIKLTNHNR
ncbi:MAG: glycosyltransferase family 2 protein [Ignavibacterium sp.]|nr:glycosyltransferase family 2 protein [Ignavibacterium sp.]